MVLIYIVGVLVYCPLSVICVLLFVCVCVCVCVFVRVVSNQRQKRGLGDIEGILKQRGLGTLWQLCCLE